MLNSSPLISSSPSLYCSACSSMLSSGVEYAEAEAAAKAGGEEKAEAGDGAEAEARCL